MKNNNFSNQQIVTMAIYLLGQGLKGFDIETIAKKADELSPGSFRWKTDPNMISDSNVWDALSNARKKKWILEKISNYFLTEIGVEFCEKNKHLLNIKKQFKSRLRGIDKEIYENTKFRIINSKAYLKITSNETEEISLNDYRDLFNLNKYMSKDQEIEKVQKHLNMFVSDKEILDKIKQVSDKFTRR